MASVAALERGRESYERQAWTDAYESLSEADRSAALGADDLESHATCDAGHLPHIERSEAFLAERAFPDWEVADVVLAGTEPEPIARLFKFDERFYRLCRKA